MAALLEVPVTAAPGSSSVAIGDVLGERFEVVAAIAVGGTAAVFACKDRALRGPAAVKVLTATSADARQRFLDEGRILANLRSPHLVQVLAVGAIDGEVPYTALELLPGRNLDQRLRQDGPLPWREVIELLAQVAGALADMHHVGVVHRDIKPGNIVEVGSRAGRRLVKVIDLGVAMVQDWARVDGGGHTPAPRRATESGLVVGTPGFYPPEAPHVAVDAHHDTFALAATLYVLCTGALPEVGALRPMHAVCDGCDAPAELEALVAAALAVDPERRVATAAEFQRRLEHIRTTHADEARPYLFAGCFELIEPLGVGAKGEVFRAYHRDAPRYVALKLLGERSKADPEARARFVREAQVLSAVRHAALPGLVECRTAADQPQPYIAMSLAAGKPAGEFCIAGNCLLPAEVIAVGRCLAGALAALHARGILHRDVHASNVLIDRTTRTTTATLVDVGMAELEPKFYAVVEQRYPLPPEQRVQLGTGGLERLAWTAPEAKAGRGWTGKSDVYSLGLLLHLLLTGKRPTTDAAGVLRSPRTLQPGCPRALASALLTALSPNPDERTDAAGLVAMLEAAADELSEETYVEEAPMPVVAPVVAEATPVTVEMAAPQRRAWAWLGAGAAAALVVIGLAWRLGEHDRGRVEPDTTHAVAVAPNVVVAPPPGPVEPPMRDVLDAAGPALRRCSSLAGGLLVVEFTTVADGRGFAGVAVDGRTTPTLDRCVRDATAGLTFAPQGPQKFTEEYNP